MLENILLMATQVATLFLMMGVGFGLSKWGKLTQDGLSQLTFVLINVVCPCIIVDSLQVEREPELVRNMGLGMLLTGGIYLIWILLSLPAFRRQPAPTRRVLQFGMIYSNTGFMGLPLIQAALGDTGLTYAVTPYVLFNVLVWSHGVALMGGREQVRLKGVIVNPGVMACVAGLALFFLNIRLPGAVGSAVGFLADMNTPLAMLVIGAQMAGADLPATLRSGRLYLAGLVRLVIFPAIYLVLLLPLKLDPVMYAVYIILGATPTAGFTSILGQRYHQDTATAAQLVTLTTLLSIITLPCFAALAQHLGG